jgi:serine/threonine-protein kinase
MLEPDALSADDERLLAVAMAIADGTPVNWLAATSSVTPPPSDEHGPGSSTVHQLQHLERLVQGHHAVRSRVDYRAASAEDTLLTQARRERRAPADNPLRVQWGPLVVLEKIGRGSFGHVYRAWDPRLDREVALKLIPEDAEDAATPVVEEGRLLARVRHPNVLTVHGAERIDGRVGIWTEYVRGETLAQEVARNSPLTPEEAARIGAEVCAALAAVHAAGLLHRDVKAQNIMRDATGRTVLGDFGTGVPYDDRAGVSDPQIAGTPLYLAPEVVAGRPATVRSDLYSVGVLLYFLVTGDYPVRGRTLAEIKQAHATARRVRLREARPDLPGPFVDIVEALIAADPDRRYGTAPEAEEALQTFLTPSVGNAQARPSVAQRVLGHRLAVFAFAGAIIISTFVAAAVWRARSTTGAASSTFTALNPGDWILVASFDNRTGEAVFEGTIDAAVKRELEYSEFVHVAQRARVGDALQSMARPLDARLDRQLAQGVSLRDGGIRAFVAGRIAKAGNTYEIVSDIVDPATRTTIATLTDRAPGHPEILDAVRRQTLRIREALGEPSSSIDRTRWTQGLAPVPHLKALHLYTQALRVHETNPGLSIDQFHSVERTLREAVEDDPTFAAAALQLALVNIPLSRAKSGQLQGVILRYTERALQLAATATPQEHYRITAHFHHTRGQIEQAAAAYEALAALQPDDDAVMVLLQNCYRELGRARDAAALDLRLADARPRNVEVNSRVAYRLLREGNFDGARRYGARAESALSSTASGVYIDVYGNTSVRLLGAYISWLEDSPRQALEVLDRVVATSDRLPEAARRELHLSMWPLYAAIGRRRQAERTIDVVRRTDGHDMVETFFEDLAKGQFFAEGGDLARLRELAAARWRRPIPRNAPFIIGGRAFLLIEAGFLEDAERDMKWLQALGLPWTATDPAGFNVTGTLELARGHREAAATSFRRALEMADMVPNVAIPSQAYANLHHQSTAVNLATILEADGKRSEAIALLEEAGRRRRDLTVFNSLSLWMRGRAQLARLYRKNGQFREAEAIEAQLLKLLAVADPDYPLLKELQARQSQSTSPHVLASPLTTPR